MNQKEDTLFKKLNYLKKELPKLIKLQGKKGDKCFFHDCNNQAIKSHSLSEAKVLSLLEDKNEKGHVVVYHIDDVPDLDFKNDLSLSTFQKTNRKLFEKGKSETSVFYGFCKKCDKETFRLVDNYPYLDNKEINFLHTLRTTAFTLTYHRNLYTDFKNKVLPAIDEAEEGFQEVSYGLSYLERTISEIPDIYDVSFEDALEFKSLIDTINTIPIKRQREEVAKIKTDLFSDLLNESNYPMKGYIFKQKMMKVKPIFESTKNDLKDLRLIDLSTEIDNKIIAYQNEIQSLTYLFRERAFKAYRFLTISIDGIYLTAGAFNYTLDEHTNISLTFFPEKETNKTHFLFASHVNDENDKYFSRLNIMSSYEFKNEVSNVILSKGTNVYISPLLWRNIPSNIQDLMISNKSKVVSERFNFFDSNFSA